VEFLRLLILLQFAKFRQLLKEVIILNDQLHKYTEKQLHLYAASCADEGEDLPLLDSAEKCRLDDADTGSVSSASVTNESSETHDSKSTEKRTVRILPVSRHHHHHNSISSSAASPPVAASTTVDDQESHKIQVTFGILCASFNF